MENNFTIRPVIRGNTCYYTYLDAIKLIDLYEEKGIPILGIDSFELSRTLTKPLLEHSIDFSNIKKEKAYELARIFLNSRENMDYMFEVVV